MLELETQSVSVPVSVRGTEITMSLRRQGVIWVLEGNGIRAVARTSTDVFIGALGIVDGKKAAKRWKERENIIFVKGGE